MSQSIDAKRNTRTQPTLTKHGPHRSPARRRGSLLILCVTVLVIIALVGIAYLQRVRMDQFATERHERSYVNLVINGILGEVSTQMKDDVEENRTDGHFLYDYPWTHPDNYEYMATKEYPTPASLTVNGYASGAAAEDDRWLASSAPVWHDVDAEYRWLHLSNITGVWVDLPEEGSNLTTPEEHWILFTPSEMGEVDKSDTDLALSTNALRGLAGNFPGNYQVRGADADADGIIDSRWQWAPESVRSLGGRKYVMAIRIVDLNSMLNVTTATSLTSTGALNAPDVARGYNPAWVDLSRLLGRVPSEFVNGSNWRRELSSLMNFRLQKLMDLNRLSASYPDDLLALLPASEVQRIWEEQGSIYGNTDRNYLVDTEMELRRFGGLNDRSETSVLETEMGNQYPPSNITQYSKALRQHVNISDDGGTIGPENSYRDVVYNLPNQPANTNQAIARWFYGDDGGMPDADADSLRVADREFPAIRHMLTSVSGAAIYAPILVNDTIGAFPSSSKTKFELHRDWDGPAAVVDPQVDKLIDQLRQVFQRNRAGGGPGGPFYLGMTDTEIEDMIVEYGIAIKDYSDLDITPTSRALPSGGTAYGLEKLPFLREVYVQALYADTDVLDGPLAPGDVGYVGPDGLNDTWVYDESVTGGDTRAMAIELGNPFAHRIHGIDPNTGDTVAQGLENNVEIRVYQGGNQIGFWPFGPSTPDIDARNDSGDEDTLIIYSPPIDKLNESLTAATTGSDMPGELNFPAGAKVLELPAGTLTSNLASKFTPGSTDRVEVELWVITPDGPRQYDRIVLDSSASLPASVAHTADASTDHQFAQASSARDSRLIHYVVDDGPTSTDSNLDIPQSPGALSAGVDRFGNDIKGFLIDTYSGDPLFDPTFFDRLQLPLSDLPMNSLAEVAQMHMFGFTNNQTFSARMSAKLTQPGLRRVEHFLLVDPREVEYDVIASPFGIPHAALLMDLFTAVGPAHDKKDNDNNDGDNILTTSADGVQEIFVPGLVNVNTAPIHLLTLGSPMGENLDEAEKLMRTIVAYRDEPLRGPRQRGAQQHLNYWSVGEAGFDVSLIRENAIWPAHLTNFSDVGSAARLNRPGIASLGELMYLNPGATLDSRNNMLRYGLDTLPTVPTLMDMYPDPSENTASFVNQGDDNEQLLARFGMLSQAYTVRSDRFAVYCVVRGYDDEKFDRPPVETARFIAIIDRGIMKNSSDQPRVIGFVRLQ